jgi:hypothetical protein
MAAVVLTSLVTYGMHFDLKLMTNRTRTKVAEGLSDILPLVDTEKWRRFWTAERWWGTYVIDITFNLIITMELIVRFFACPYKKRFLKSAPVVLEIIVLTTYFLAMTLTIALISIGSNTALQWTWLLLMSVQLLRPLRIIRLANTFAGLRILLLVLRKSSYELLTVIIFLCMGMMLFSFLIFAAEIGVEGNFPTVWDGAWWAIITMTTVGYGDTYPESGLGYFVGIACAITGIVIVGFSIPILSSNFNMYYGHVHLAMKKVEEKLKKVQQVLAQDKCNGSAKTEWVYTISTK